jgi:nucleoside-diphosphate-sugar epimerase
MCALSTEEYFFERLAIDRPICIPGHGQYITGLGHVKDLAMAMAQVIGRDHTKGQVYNIQVQFANFAEIVFNGSNHIYTHYAG